MKTTFEAMRQSSFPQHEKSIHYYYKSIHALEVSFLFLSIYSSSLHEKKKKETGESAKNFGANPTLVRSD